MSTIICMIVFIFGSFGGSDCSTAPFKIWTMVEGVYYFLNLIFSWAYYYKLTETNRESTRYLIFNCFLNFCHSGWLIYGNIIFWPNYASCGEEMINSGSNINWIMGFLIVLGYITLCKCCTVTTVFVCFAPSILRAYRSATDPSANW
jgi:hypothetical protein